MNSEYFLFTFVRPTCKKINDELCGVRLLSNEKTLSRKNNQAREGWRRLRVSKLTKLKSDNSLVDKGVPVLFMLTVVVLTVVEHSKNWVKCRNVYAHL